MGELPFSVKHKRVVSATAANMTSAGNRSFLAKMVEKAEACSQFAEKFENWLTSGPRGEYSTVYLRDEIMPDMRPKGDGKVAVHPKYCTCCKEVHGKVTYRDWSYWHDTPWEALDSAKAEYFWRQK